MDTNLGVALAAKLLKLFPSDNDTFLSFPMATGLAFSKDDLDFLGDDQGRSASDVRLKMERRSQFARLLNLIPKDSLVYSSLDRLLWEEYSGILKGAELAESLLTREETEELKKAEEFLMDVREEDGVKVRVYSPELEKYYEYKEAYEEIERTYLDEEITAQSAEGAEKDEWESRRKAELLSLKKSALSDWELLGSKNKVEECQMILTRLSGKLPRRYVTDYLNDLAACREEDLLTNDPVGTFSTFYSPSDTFDPDVDWASIHLTSFEIRGLLREAPDELKRFASQGADDVESVTIQYAKVVVMRPWLHQEFFGSRYWKLPEREGLVSDGGIPRDGKIPAFITNMIVARSIRIDRLKKKPRGGSSAPLTVDAAKALRFLGPELRNINQEWKVTAGQNVKMVQKNAPARSARTVHTVAARPVTVHAVRDHRTPAAVAARPLVGVALVPPAQRTAFQRAKINRTTMRRSNVTVAVPARRASRPTPPPAQKERVTEEVKLDGVAVLAFECRRLPRCPDPDNTLDWT